MSKHAIKQGILFGNLSNKAVAVKFDQAHASSDGGAILLKACDEQLGLIERFSACLPDGRRRSKVRHSLEALLRQRMFGIACGYADGNDASRLRGDPVMKLSAGRYPVVGAAP